MADPGVGGLAYSGKIMAPVPLTPNVERLRDRLMELTNMRFDCCLVNWYQDGAAACKWHSDPEHGSKWSLEQAVVSFGEVRRFNLKRIQGAEGGSSADKRALDADPAHSFHVRDGDVVHMFGDCQDSFLHSVSKGQGENEQGPRISIVFKASLLSASGKRGHGVAQARAATSAPRADPDAATKFKLPPKRRKKPRIRAASHGRPGAHRD